MALLDPDPGPAAAEEPSTGGGRPPLKVGLVTDCYVPRLGGIEMQVHDLAQHLQRAGHQVVVITSTPGPELVDGVRYSKGTAVTHSLVMRSRSGTIRTISSEHHLAKLRAYSAINFDTAV